MVSSREFKKKIERSLSQDFRVEFLGKNFDKIAEQISGRLADKIYSWMDDVIQKKFQPITIGQKKAYKDWTMDQLLVFRYPFIVQKSEYRILLVKVKNSVYIELHLGNRKYYDKVRRDMGLKKGSN